MLFKVAATALVVPPVSLAFLVLFGLLIRRWYQRTGLMLAGLGIVALLIFGMPVVGNLLLITLEQDLPLTPPPDQPPQAIVILGGDTQRGTWQEPRTHLGPLSLERVRTGAVLARQTGLPVLVSGGNPYPGEPPIAVVMADSLMHDFQVPVRWVERESRDTWEDARMSAVILREAGIHSVYVVTQAWHMRRAIQAFAATGITTTAAPPRLDQVPVIIARDFVPEAGGWLASYHAMHEWVGRVWYGLK